MLRLVWWYQQWVSPHRWSRRVRVFWQRGTRGWSDEDTWSLDEYLTDIIIGGCMELQDRDIGHPSDLNSIEEWKAILAHIVDGFAARKMLDRMDQYSYGKDGRLIHDAAEEYRLERLAEEGMDLFVHWFGGLWD